ncbi:hypothetical protein GCM10023331_17590 [Algivirga pacifica]|uniref:Transposase DDE domain-containing protein n=1 Tax=Algivirga pacifica TaxID=1162670 RepID=A0ABP9D8Y7_9BACT
MIGIQIWPTKKQKNVRILQSLKAFNYTVNQLQKVCRIVFRSAALVVNVLIFKSFNAFKDILPYILRYTQGNIL